ncbi:hypothetical protein Clacol_007930 [Clathrus columnatus]|uniref:Uncharacterized protein n=1 Tax=Clathrus columnatus TaxID=1419009 RepID=A0AAV5ALT7_9AGAM|nr:hypothetical protein Clacol_007930 [Clathrus columnatus]
MITSPSIDLLFVFVQFLVQYSDGPRISSFDHNKTSGSGTCKPGVHRLSGQYHSSVQNELKAFKKRTISSEVLVLTATLIALHIHLLRTTLLTFRSPTKTMSSSFVLRNQVPHTDENLIYLQRKGVINYPMNYNFTSLDSSYAVIPISKTVRKKHELQNWANDKARFIPPQDANLVYRNGPRFDENHNPSSQEITPTSSKLGSKWGDITSNNESPGTRSGEIQAGLNVRSNENNAEAEDNHINLSSQWEDFVEWVENQHYVDVDIEGQRQENTGGVGKGIGLATEPETDIQCSSEYKQNKGKGKALSEHNPDVGMTYAQHPQQSLYHPIPRNNVFFVNDSFPNNIIHNNSIIPAQTQILENVPRARQYVYDNGSQPYQYYNHSENEVRWPDAPNTNTSYYQTEFVQGSSKGNPHPSFRVQPNYTSERGTSLPPNLFNYMPPTRSKRPREDEFIEQPSSPPLKRHNRRQTPPHFPPMRTPSPFPSLAPMWDVIPPQFHMQPSCSFSGMNVPFSLPERGIASEVLAARHYTKETAPEKDGWESQEEDDCEDDEDEEGKEEDDDDDTECEDDDDTEGDEEDDDIECEEDEDTEGEECHGEDEYEYI